MNRLYSTVKFVLTRVFCRAFCLKCEHSLAVKLRGEFYGELYSRVNFALILESQYQ